MLAHVDLRLLPVLFTAYVMWSPWHYTGQNYGLLMMFVRRAGLEVSPAQARRLKLAFAASFVMLLAAFNEGPSSDPTVLSLGLPHAVTRVAGWTAAGVFLGARHRARCGRSCAAPAPAAAAPVLLFLTQGLWFVAPIVLSWATSVPTPQTRYSSGILAVMHSAQYLWITQYFARREQGAVVADVGLLGVGRCSAAWRCSCRCRGWPATRAHVDFTASVLIVTAVVNLHHFMIDGVVWKLRDPRVSRALTAAAAVAGRAAGPGPRHRPWRAAAIGVAAVALVLLAGLDQWRYRLALRESDPAALATAARVNPYDSVVQGRLLRTLVERGDDEALRAHLEATIARNPGDVDAQVNAGVLARRQGRLDDAARHWTDALAHDPGLTHVQLYLAELLDDAGSGGRCRPALPRLSGAGGGTGSSGPRPIRPR